MSIAKAGQLDSAARQQTTGITRTYVLLCLITVVAGGHFVVAKFALMSIPPLTLAAARFVPSALFLLILLQLSNGGRPKVRLADLPLILVLGLTGFTLSASLIHIGMRVASASESAIISATNPGITMLFATLLLRERLRVLMIVGLILAFGGVVSIALSKDGLTLSADHALADLAVLGMAASVALYSVLSKFALRRLSPLAVSAYGCTIAAVTLVPVALLAEGGWQPVTSASWQVWLAIGYMVALSTIFINLAWLHCLKRLEASRAAIFSNAAPVAGMFFAMIFLDETVTIVGIIGTAMVIGGIALATRSRG